MKYIPYGRQWVTKTDIKNVVRILKSDWLTQGPFIEQFESAVAKYCGAKYAVAVSSGTAALHIACLAAGLGKDDLLWTSPNTFVASANCALYCRAKPGFVDIDFHTYNINVSALECKLADAEGKRYLPKFGLFDWRLQMTQNNKRYIPLAPECLNILRQLFYQPT